MNVIRRIFRWFLAGDLHAEYLRGWGHGVDQERMEPESCEHHSTVNYWGEDDR